jgi:hypothetical protein
MREEIKMIKKLGILMIAIGGLLANSSFAYNCSGLPQYAPGPIAVGAIIKNVTRAFRCNVSGWCQQGGPYAPGAGWAWPQAWTDLGACDGGSSCSGLQNWNVSTAYIGGFIVQHNSVKYTAAYWTQGQNPATNNASGQAWISNGACSGDSQLPTANITFPPPRTRTNHNSITIVGTASDNIGVAAVRVNSSAVSTTNNFANWQTTRPLTGDHTFQVDVRDVNNNFNANADLAGIQYRTAFTWTGKPRALAHDGNSGLYFVDGIADAVLRYDTQVAGGRVTLVSNNSGANAQFPLTDATHVAVADGVVLVLIRRHVIKIDIATGTRSMLTSPTFPSEVPAISVLEGLALGPKPSDSNAAWEAYITDQQMFVVYAVNMNTGARRVLSGMGVPDNINNFTSLGPRDLVVDAANQRLIVATGDTRLLAININTGARTVLSTTGTSPSIAYDPVRNRVLFAGSNSRLEAINLTTGVRSTVSGTTQPATVNIIESPGDIAYDVKNNVAYLMNNFSTTPPEPAVAVQASTGERVYVDMTLRN